MNMPSVSVFQGALDKQHRLLTRVHARRVALRNVELSGSSVCSRVGFGEVVIFHPQKD